MKTERHPVAGILLLALAAFVVYIAFAEHSLSAEKYLLLLAVAAILFLSGIQLLLAVTGRFSYLLGGCVLAIFSCCGFFIAISGGTVQGGLPFLPTAWNQLLGHIMFGIGGIITGFGAFLFFKRGMRS